MTIRWRFLPNSYRDSVALMALARQVEALPGVSKASAAMGTAANLGLLREAGFALGDLPPQPDAVFLLVRGPGDPAELEAALDQAQTWIESPETGGAGTQPGSGGRPGSGSGALASLPSFMAARQAGADWVLLSVPGEVAGAEALKALESDLNVMMFSDQVPLDQERFLKARARDKGLLFLGPDCGTSWIDGVPLGFANGVRRGPVGLVSASGTGLQEVACLLDRAGSGLSCGYGVGGRDLGQAVGAAATLQVLERLGADPATEVIGVISKPPHPEVARRVRAAAEATGKPVVFHFVGDGEGTLAQAADTLLARLGHPPVSGLDQAPAAAPRRRGHLRGLYAGGTLAYEALCALRGLGRSLWSPLHVEGVGHLRDPWARRDDTITDLGDDEFTRGRPHPMIDQSLRLERLAQELADPQVGLVLIDLVLGWGSHPDPAAELAAVIQAAAAPPLVLAAVVGTEADPQPRSAQVAALEAAGVLVAPSHGAALAWVRQWIQGGLL